MKIHRFEADDEGYMRVATLIRPLGFGLFGHKPAFWGVIDPLGKQGASCNLVAIEDGQTIDPTLIPGYRSTIVDNEKLKVWHVFEEPSKILKGGANPGDLKKLGK